MQYTQPPKFNYSSPNYKLIELKCNLIDLKAFTKDVMQQKKI